MISTLYCPTCGAANEATHTRCFACDGVLASNDTYMRDKPLLLGRYQILATLGTGGFSQVYQAQDTWTDQLVAIKQINLRGLTPEETIDATNTFNRERTLLSALNHPQVPHLFDSFQDREHWYLVLEYLDGPTLETYLETRQGQGKPILFAETLSMALQLCSVLEHLHTRQPAIIFRDLKPGNIIRHPGGKLSLIDFGIARHYQRGQARDTQLLGSPGYAAPEQYGRAQTSPQSDIYSLGVLLYALLSGEDPSQRDPDLTTLRLSYLAGGAQMRVLLEHMLASDPGARPRSVREVKSELEGLQQHQYIAQENGRIWIPPTPQTYIATTSGVQQHIQTQLSTPSQHHVSRRRVLVGLGILVAASSGGYFWWQSQSHNTNPYTYTYTYYGHTASVTGVAWSPDSQSIASIARDSTVLVWQASNGKYLAQQDGPATGGGLCWSPDGTAIASSYESSSVLVWAASTGSILNLYAGHRSAVRAVAYDRRGENVATASADETVQVWNAQNSVTVATYKGHTGVVNAVSWSPDGQYIASGGNDGTVQVWDATTGSLLITYSGHIGSVNAVAWSPDGQFIASGSTDVALKVWRPEDGSEFLTYSGHSAGINAIAWSPNSSLIASASDDMTVQILDISGGGAPAFTYTGHTDAVLTVSWSSDGKFIASGSADKTVEVWTIQNNV